MKRSIKIISGLVLLSAALFFAARTSLFSRSQEVQIQTQEVTRQDLFQEISATGAIHPRNVVEVGTQVSGTIAEIAVDYNDRVEKEQVLARLDTRALEAQVRENQVAVNRTKAQLEQARLAYERAQKLFEKEMNTKRELEEAEVNHEAAKANHESAQLQLEQSQVNLDYATITSPIDGVILSRNIDAGQTVAASFSTPTLFTIASSLENMQIEADVGEADVGTVQTGQKVRFSVDTYPDETFTGEVRQVRLEPETSQNVVTYTAIIDIPNPDLKLLPGMTAYVNIIEGGVEDVLTVPQSAISLIFSPEQMEMLEAWDYEIHAPQEAPIRIKKDTASSAAGPIRMTRDGTQGPGSGLGIRMKGNMGFVWVKNGETIERRTVQTGFSDGIFTEVTDGLEEGEEIVLNVGQQSQAIMQSQSQSGRSPLSPTIRMRQ